MAPRILGSERQPVVVVGLGPAEPCLALRPRERMHSAAQPLVGELLGLAGRRAEAGAPEEALGFLRAETASVDGDGHDYPFGKPAGTVESNRRMLDVLAEPRGRTNRAPRLCSGPMADVEDKVTAKGSRRGPTTVTRSYFKALNDHDLPAAAAHWEAGRTDRIIGIVEFRMPEGFMQWFGALLAAFPDIRFEVLSITAQKDTAAVRYRVAGTFDGVGRVRGPDAEWSPSRPRRLRRVHRQGRTDRR